MKRSILGALLLCVSCSNLDSVNTFGNLLSGGNSGASQAWVNLPKIIHNYLYDDNSPVFAQKKSRHEDDLNETLAIIYSEGKCYGPNGKEMASDSLCKEISDLVGKVKLTRAEIMKMHLVKTSKGPFSEDSTIAGSINDCVEEFLEYKHELSTGDTKKMLLGCKQLLQTDADKLMKKSKEIRNHLRSKDLALDQFDAFSMIGLKEEDVSLTLANIAKSLPTLDKHQSKNSAESSIRMYCMYVESYKHADEIISETENPFKRQKMINDKKKMPQVMDAIKLEYEKNTGKKLDESSCNLK